MNYCKTDEKREFFEEKIKEIKDNLKGYIKVRLEEIEDEDTYRLKYNFSENEIKFYRMGMNDVKRFMKEEIKKTLKWYG